MTILEVYRHYRIMANLQLHHFRVAGVALLTCRALKPGVIEATEVDRVVQASLLHDLGNIIKFDLTVFPESVQPEGLKYWQQVKQETIEHYGKEEHQATMMMIEELGVDKRVKELVSSVGFDQIEEVSASGDLAREICEYADSRVAPRGVVTFEERLQDLEERYGRKYSSPAQRELRRRFFDIDRRMAAHIQTQSTRNLDSITEAEVLAVRSQLERTKIGSTKKKLKNI